MALTLPGKTARPKLLLSAALLAGACAPRPAASRAAPADGHRTLLANVEIVDGTGAPARRAGVRLAGDRIVAVGELHAEPGEGVVDGGGMVLAPGFVDPHSHADTLLAEQPDALGAVSQGITTVIVGQDGSSPLPLDETFARLGRAPAAVNVASYVGHNTLRERTMGKDPRRRATEAEILAMRALLREEMKAGALGLSTGLEYDPGVYSDPAEVLALAREAAAAGGRYISHVRSEDRALWAAVDELVDIGREARLPVHLSHAKLAMRDLWGSAPRLLARLDEARAGGVEVTADVYPYAYWSSTMTVLFPGRDFEDVRAADFALDHLVPPEGLVLTRYDPDPSYVGQSLAEISRTVRRSPSLTLLDLIRASRALEAGRHAPTESVLGASMDERDVERILAWPSACVSTDGELDDGHPRAFGAFPRVLGVYVRERRILGLEEAVRKMTSLPAASVGLRDRGRIAPGAFADLVLLDPATVVDRATPSAPHTPAEGILRVWVNGEVVYERGRVTGRRPGRALRRPGR